VCMLRDRTQPRAYLPASDASLCQFLVLLPGQCAQILLPSRCHKDQGPTAVLAIRPLTCTSW
jgi:hypothetical protein